VSDVNTSGLSPRDILTSTEALRADAEVVTDHAWTCRVPFDWVRGEIEGVQHGFGNRARRCSASKTARPSGPQTAGSQVNDLARTFPWASTVMEVKGRI